MAIQIQIRRDTAANWTSANPLLADGELGYEKDTGRLKTGDGVNSWNTLPYHEGETNTASNVGSGEGLYTTKSGVDLQFKSLIAGDGIGFSSDATSITISGSTGGGGSSDVQSFLDLNDTPSAYVSGQHLRTTASGIVLESEYIENLVYVHAEYTGAFEDGSYAHPFKSIMDGIIFVYTNYTESDSVGVHMLPGTYVLPYQVAIAHPAIKSITGTSASSVIMKPAANLVGGPFAVVTQPLTISNVTMDATDNPDFLTTPGSIGTHIIDSSGEQIYFENCVVKGFNTGFTVLSGSNVWFRTVEIHDGYDGVVVGDGSLFDADLLYIDGMREYHFHAYGGAEAYIGESEFSSAYVEGLTSSGTAVYVEGDDTYVELFAGTNIWSVDQNIHVQNTSTVRIDNCVLEETNNSPGIDQLDTSSLYILNSRAPLGVSDLSIADPDNVYINAFDSTNSRTLIGNGSDVNQEILAVNAGKDVNPHFFYEADHNTDYKALAYHNHEAGENAEFYVSAWNGSTSLGVHPQGTDAQSQIANVGLVSIQEGVRSGWNLSKEVGSTPDFTIRNKNDIVAFTAKYDGDVALNTGVDVNKILDEDTFVSNDPKALVTQQSTKAYIDNNHYSSTALDSGQLDNRYYTETEVDNLFVTVAADYVKRDGTTELTADWDVGDYTLTASGFQKDNTRVDLASYANITGILTGGALTINADPTKLDIAAGTSIYVDQTDRDNPTVETLSWDATTVDSQLAGIRSRWVGIYRVSAGVGGIITDTEFTQLEKRSIALVGRYWGNGTSTITGKGNYTGGAFSFGKSMEDLAYAIGSVNIKGNDFSTSTTSGTLDRSSGQALRFSAGYSNSNISPNIIDSSAQEALSVYQYHLKGATSTIIESTIDTDNYDDGGVKTAVPAGKWTAQRIYYFPGSSNIHVVYDQNYHDSKTLAYDGIVSDNLILNENILEGSILRAYLVVCAGCTDLNDPNQATIFTAYSDPGLLPGVTNHGELGGLQDDDHPQYHNDARGDTRYYTQTQTDAWRVAHPFTASGISYDNSDWNVTNVEDALDSVLEYTEGTIGTGRIAPETALVQTGATTLLVIGGVGFISYQDYHRKVTWSNLPIDIAGKDTNVYHLYVDVAGTVIESNTEPDRTDYIYLGFYYVATGTIGVISNNDCILDQTYSRIAYFMERLGSFIYDEGGAIQLLSGFTNRITSTPCKVQRIMKNYDLTEVSSNDAGTRFLPLFYAPQVGWGLDFEMVYNTGMSIPANRYNDTTASGAQPIMSGYCVFTNGSNQVISTANMTSDIDPGDMIFYATDGIYTMATVSGVSWTGSQTNIDLYFGYRGTTATGVAVLNKSLPFLPDGKYTKHRIARDVNDNMYFLYGNTIYDTEADALAAPLPALPASTEIVGVNIAGIVATTMSGVDSLDFIDARPLPFRSVSAGSSSGGGGVGTASDHGELTGLGDDDHAHYLLANGQRNVSGRIQYTAHPTFVADTDLIDKKYVDDLAASFNLDHGGLTGIGDDDHTQYSLVAGTRDYTGIVSYDTAKTFTTDAQIVDKKYVDDLVSTSVVSDHGGLTGLGDDDHTIYTRVNGTRDFTGKVSYSVHPTFIADTEIVDKKYVDDGLSAYTTDHGGLGGLSDDDHPQYLNVARGDARYYTETEVDNLFTSHNAADDHDGVYYTEAEVEALLTTVSGALQDQLDSLGGATYLYAESNTESSTTSSTFQTKTSIVFGSGITGTYRLAYSIEYQATQANKNVLVRLYNSTDATVLGGVAQQTNSSGNWFSLSGFIHVPVTGSNKTFQLQYAAGTANCSVRNARLEARRVS